MPKVSTKEHKNIYFKARESLGLTRDKAADLLDGIQPEAIEKIENERRTPYPYEVLEMADKYGSPELCNYFCAHQCDIGKRYVPEIKIKELSQIILELLASLNAMNKRQERLIEITADGQIANDELDDFIAIQNDLERISITVETLQLWSEQMLSSGKIDIAAYQKRKNKK